MMFNTNWKWILARGILGICFGILALVYPFAGLFAVAWMFAAYVMADGIFALTSSVSCRKRGMRWGFLALEGVVGIVAGVAGFLFPGAALLTLIFLVGAWALISGLVEIYA